MLDDLARRLQSHEPSLVAAERAEAAGVALAAAIQAIQVATDCFDEAIRRNPDLIEAYRDRGLADLLLAQSEGTLALLEDSDPNLGPWLKQFCPELALPPEKLDRAIVYGRMDFNDAIERLHAAKAKQARVAAEKKGISDAASAIVKQYVAQAAKRGDGDAHPAEQARNGAGRDEPDGRAGQTSAARRRNRRGVQDHREPRRSAKPTPKSTLRRPRWTRATRRSTAASTCSGPGNRPTRRARRAILPGPKA